MSGLAPRIESELVALPVPVAVALPDGQAIEPSAARPRLRVSDRPSVSRLAARQLCHVADNYVHGRLQIQDDTRFQRIASVGMFEHAGQADMGLYAGGVCDLLEPGGLTLQRAWRRSTPRTCDPRRAHALGRVRRAGGATAARAGGAQPDGRPTARRAGPPRVQAVSVGLRHEFRTGLDRAAPDVARTPGWRCAIPRIGGAQSAYRFTRHYMYH